MFVEFTQLIYNKDEQSWDINPIMLQAKAIVGFYKHPDYDGSTVVLLHGTDPVLVQESVDEIKQILNDVTKPLSGKWVDMEYQPPKMDGEYLVTTNRLSCSVDFDEFKNGKWKNYGNNVIAWMLIPKPYWMVNAIK